MKIFAPHDSQKLLGEVKTQTPDDTFFESVFGVEHSWAQTPFETRLDSVKKMLNFILESSNTFWNALGAETGRSDEDLSFERNQFKNWIARMETDVQALSEMQGAPVGRILILVPAVWPFHFGFAYAALSLLCGNSAWIKFSETGAWAGLQLAENLRKQFSDLPLFAFAGDAECGRRQALNPNYESVLFFGSTESGSRLRQELISQPFKELFLNMGSKNLAWIQESANPSPENLQILFDSSLRANGYHCRAVNTFLVPATRLQEWTDAVYSMAKSFPVEDVSATGINAGNRRVGPLPQAALVDRYLKWVGMIEREGAEILMRGKTLERKPRGNYVAPTIAVFRDYDSQRFKKSIVQQTELLGPLVQLIPYTESNAWGNVASYFDHCHYGLTALVLGQDQAKTSALPVGCVAWNKATLNMDFSSTLISRKKSGAGSVQGIGLARRLSRKTFVE